LDLPPELAAYCQSIEAVPKTILKDLFPDPCLSVHDFIMIRMPNKSYGLINRQAEDWFSTLQPSKDAMHSLIDRPLPGETLLNGLSKALQQAILDRKNSVIDW
jgi:hypothetical protein